LGAPVFFGEQQNDEIPCASRPNRQAPVGAGHDRGSGENRLGHRAVRETEITSEKLARTRRAGLDRAADRCEPDVMGLTACVFDRCESLHGCGPSLELLPTPLQVRFEQLEQKALTVAEVTCAVDEDENTRDALLRREADVEPVVDPFLAVELVPDRRPTERTLGGKLRNRAGGGPVSRPLSVRTHRMRVAEAPVRVPRLVARPVDELVAVAPVALMNETLVAPVEHRVARCVRPDQTREQPQEPRREWHRIVESI